MNLKPSLKLGGQEVVLVLTIQMSALFSCAVLKNSYFRHWVLCTYHNN